MLVKLDHFLRGRGEFKKKMKLPPTRKTSNGKKPSDLSNEKNLSNGSLHLGQRMGKIADNLRTINFVENIVYLPGIQTLSRPFDKPRRFA